MSESAVKTPCVGVCRMDFEDKYCTGCFRTREEIVTWRAANDDERREIIARIEERKAAS